MLSRSHTLILVCTPWYTDESVLLASNWVGGAIATLSPTQTPTSPLQQNICNNSTETQVIDTVATWRCPQLISLCISPPSVRHPADRVVPQEADLNRLILVLNDAEMAEFCLEQKLGKHDHSHLRDVIADTQASQRVLPSKPRTRSLRSITP